MAKTTKHLEVQARYIYNPEFEVCLHCGDPLRARRHYEWRKTVQKLDGAVNALMRNVSTKDKSTSRQRRKW